jgi:hypothetical protein
VAAEPEIFSLYSDLCRDKATGDLIGDRLVIVHLDKTYGLYQTGTGAGISKPILVPVSIVNGVISFTVDLPDIFSGIFSGKITPSLVSGEFKNSHGERLGFGAISLPRRRSSDNMLCK